MGRRRPPRMPSLDETHHTLAKIKRIGLGIANHLQAEVNHILSPAEIPTDST